MHLESVCLWKYITIDFILNRKIFTDSFRCFNLVRISLIFCSEEKCRPAPDQCSDIIPYTSMTNKLYDLETEEDFKNFSMSLHMALENCTMDKDVARWGACNMIYPRCLMGWELQFCRQSCLGRDIGLIDY